MKIQFASDLHLEFRENWRYLRDNGPMDVKGDILVLAGDTGFLGDDMYSVHPFWDWASENFEQVLVALGNHEFYKYYDLKTIQDGLVGIFFGDSSSAQKRMAEFNAAFDAP